jgi:hypothetical protein
MCSSEVMANLENTKNQWFALGFDFCGFRLSYDKMILAKSCLAKFEKRLSKLYEQLSKCKSSSCKNKFTTTGLLKKIKLYVLRFGRWTIIIRQTVLRNCTIASACYSNNL